MSHDHEHGIEPPREVRKDAGGNRARWAFLAFAATAAFFLTTEHRAHLFGVLPYLLLLACPLLHWFMHRGHGGHGGHGARESDRGKGDEK